MKGRKKRTITLAILCCLLVFMGVGFSVARTTLSIGGTSTAVNTWSILIDSITPKENQTDAVSVSATVDEVTKTNASFEVDFKKPGDYMEYTVVIKNNGSINGYIDKVNATMDDPNSPDNRLFKITSDVTPGISINAGESISFIVKIEFDKDATTAPSTAVKFALSAEILQGEGTGGGGNTPGGGGGSTPEPDVDWDFEVDESGTILAYNYELGTDVVVPAEVGGIPVTTLTEQSFLPKGNVEVYANENPMGMYAIIHESEPKFTQVKNKLIELFTAQCGGDGDCVEQYKSIVNICSDDNTCYNILNQEQNAVDPTVELVVTSMPATAQLMQSMTINPDPGVSLEDSMSEPKPNVKTLDLSNATNLTTIEDSALSDAGLESVDFGDNSNITSIGNSAFSNNGLTIVEIPDSVETIGSSAFYNNQIETLTFGATPTVQNQLTKNKKYSLSKIGTTVEKTTTSNSKLKTIENSAFSNNKIKALNLPNALETIGDYSFSNNQISGELIIPSSVTTIKYGAFGSNNISKLYFPKTVTSLESWVFENNPIQTLTIEECNTTICSGYGSGNNYFGNKIKNLTIQSGEIGSSAFSSSESSTTKIETLTLGEGITSIGDSAFANNAITEIILPETLTTIGLWAFQNNVITNLTLPNSVTTIMQDAFSNNKIDTLTIGRNITEIHEYSFSNNPIQNLTIGECNTTICSGYNSDGNKYFGNKIKNLTIQSGEIGNYAFSSSESSTTKIETLTLGEGVTSIGDDAFMDNSITELTLPDSIISIGTRAFKNNQISNELIIPPSITSIGSQAFSSNNIVTLYFPKTVTSLGSYAFENNPIETLTIEECNTTICSGTSYSNKYFGNKIKNLTIQSGEIGDYAFSSSESSTTKIEALILGEGVTSIGDYAFYNNNILTLYFPKTVTNMAGNVFRNNPIQTLTIEECNGVSCPARVCSSGGSKFGNQIESLVIKSGEVGDNSFCHMDGYGKKIKNLTLEEGVTSIGDSAFWGNEISQIDLPSTLKNLSGFNNNLLTEVIIPDSVVTIGNFAFSGNQLSEIYIPSNVTSIGNDAFNNNRINVDLVIPSAVISIGYNAFKNNQITGNLEIPSSVTSIGNSAFENNQISKMYFPKTVTSLGNDAFAGNTFNELTIQECKSGSCSSSKFGNTITTLTLESGEVGNYVFEDNTITTLNLGSITKIGQGAFINNQIQNVTIPSTVTSIGISAFNNQRDSEGNGTLSSILIKRTEADFLANVTRGTGWYDDSLNPTITYDPS